MAGILANSASASMLAGATSADNSVSGRVTGEQVTLTVTPAGSSYSWSIAVPSGSSPARSALSAETGASVKFTPDAAGYYTVTCLVDGVTLYVLRISVTATAIAQLVEAIRLSPKVDATVPTPSMGVTLYYSSTHNALVVKDSAGVIKPVTLGAAL